MMPWQQPKLFSNISATTAPFRLSGGKYLVQCIGTSFGTVDLQILGPDGSTYLSVLSAAFAANGVKVVECPDGMYEVVISSTTGVYVRIDPIYEG